MCSEAEQSIDCIASGGAFIRIFRKLSTSKKLNGGIFSWIGTMIALWVYIKPKKFGFDIFYGFWENDQKLKMRNNAPLGHWSAGTKILRNWADNVCMLCENHINMLWEVSWLIIIWNSNFKANSSPADQCPSGLMPHGALFRIFHFFVSINGNLLYLVLELKW